MEKGTNDIDEIDVKYSQLRQEARGAEQELREPISGLVVFIKDRVQRVSRLKMNRSIMCRTE